MSKKPKFLLTKTEQWLEYISNMLGYIAVTLAKLEEELFPHQEGLPIPVEEEQPTDWAEIYLLMGVE
jgi:hypothetical protein